MYKTKKENLVFYQKKEIRKISLIEILMMAFGVYILFISFREGVHPSRIGFASVIVLLILANYFAPVFQKRYNATITKKEVILDNIELLPIHLKISQIQESIRASPDTVIIKGHSYNQRFEYNITMDEEDCEVFLDAITKAKNQIFNQIKTEINNTILH